MDNSIHRLNWIDRAKGFAILLVVIGHLYYFSYSLPDDIAFRFIYSFHMPLFLFLSGFVVSKAIDKPFWGLQKLIRNILRLLMPMLVFGFLFTLSYSSVSNLKEFYNVFYRFFVTPEKSGYWYLMTLSVFYVSLQLFRINRIKSVLVDFLVALASFIFFVVMWKFTSQVNDPFCLLNCCNFYFFFILGVLSNKYEVLNYLIRRNWIYTIALFVYLLLFNISLSGKFYNSLSSHIIVPLCAVIIFVYLFYLRQDNNFFVERQFEFLGRHTLDIYVLHYFVISKINLNNFAKLFVEYENSFLLFWLSVILAFFISYFCVFIGSFLHKSDIVEKFVYFRYK